MKRKVIATYKSILGTEKCIYAPSNIQFSSKALVKHLDYAVTYKLGNGFDLQIGEFRGVTDSGMSIFLKCDDAEKIIPIQNIIMCELVS